MHMDQRVLVMMMVMILIEDCKMNESGDQYTVIVTYPPEAVYVIKL